MNRDVFAKELSGRFRGLQFSWHLPREGALTLTTRCKKRQEDSDDDMIYYILFLYFDSTARTVYGYEEARQGGKLISKEKDFKTTLIDFGEGERKPITLIMQTLAVVSGDFGWRCIQVHEPIENRGISGAAGVAGVVGKGTPSLTPNRGTGASINTGAGATGVTRMKTSNQNKKKSPVSAIIGALIVVVLMIVLVITIGKGREESVENHSIGKETIGKNSVNNKASVGKQAESPVLSKGVSATETGNMINSQYYFATDKMIFYSSFDKDVKAHIYSAEKDGTKLKPIFNGFGYFLTVFEDWLYFLGNEGNVIDGTYNLFRLKTDGSKHEKLVNTYCANLFIYDKHLYYLKQDATYTNQFDLYRSSLEGKDEEKIVKNAKNPIVYKNYLYYQDNIGNLFRTEIDGSNPKVILPAEANFYVISGEKIIYIDYTGNIKECDLVGGNIKTLRNKGEQSVHILNTHGGKIFFVEYNNDSYDYAKAGWPYQVKSMDQDGKNEKTVFSSLSYGMYMNLVNNRLMLLDYVRHENGTDMTASIKSMNLDGSDQIVLEH